ncbi:MAG TPA: hypothetical protein VHR66_17230 [Gemmataceae bacterium]|jgi:hypothetical protein|nr:hypothetical protein [Gemmataceae bacterium]
MRTSTAVTLVVAVCPALIAAPQLKPKPSEVPSLAGTTWVGKSSDGDEQTITFEAEGKMTLVKRGNPFTKCSWTQDGAKVMWEVNDRYSEHTGVISGDKIEVSSHNRTGKTWTVTLTRKRE